jgi:hypothetical protein
MENPSAMRREGAIARGGQALVLETEHAQAGQKDLGHPGQQEGQHRPPVPEQCAAAKPGDGRGRDLLGADSDRVLRSHRVPLVAGRCLGCQR